MPQARRDVLRLADFLAPKSPAAADRAKAEIRVIQYAVEADQVVILRIVHSPEDR